MVAAVVLVDWYLYPALSVVSARIGYRRGYLAAFVMTALVATIAVDQASRRRTEASHLRQEADLLGTMATRLLQSDTPQTVVNEIGRTLRRRSVTLLAPAGEAWEAEASAGEPPLTTPTDGEHYAIRDGHVLVMDGPALDGEQQRLVAASSVTSTPSWSCGICKPRRARPRG